LADRRGPRGVLLVGFLGFGVTMLVFSFAESLTTDYAERFLSGMFAAVVASVAAAVVGGMTTTEQGRARRWTPFQYRRLAGRRRANDCEGGSQYHLMSKLDMPLRCQPCRFSVPGSRPFSNGSLFRPSSFP
jgi:hypothetical protein